MATGKCARCGKTWPTPQYDGLCAYCEVSRLSRRVATLEAQRQSALRTLDAHAKVNISLAHRYVEDAATFLTALPEQEPPRCVGCEGPLTLEDIAGKIGLCEVCRESPS